MSKKKLTDQQIKDVIDKYLIGFSTYKLADEYNVSQQCIIRLLNKQNLIRSVKESCKFQNRKGENNNFYGKKHSDESKKKMSEFAKERIAERNPNYKNGKYIRRPKDFKIAIFKPIRNDIFTRDNHTCYYCKKRGGHLHAHHKIPYWVKPEAFLDKDNLITVCTECHFSKAHKNCWYYFDTSIIEIELIKKYNLDAERLNVLGMHKHLSDSLTSVIKVDKTESLAEMTKLTR